jgi:hypothetical protein
VPGLKKPLIIEIAFDRGRDEDVKKALLGQVDRLLCQHDPVGHVGLSATYLARRHRRTRPSALSTTNITVPHLTGVSINLR